MRDPIDAPCLPRVLSRTHGAAGRATTIVVAALAIAAVLPQAAQAQHRHGRWHSGGWWWGPAVAAGLYSGAALAYPYGYPGWRYPGWGYAGPYPGAGYPGYGYGYPFGYPAYGYPGFGFGEPYGARRFYTVNAG